MAGRPTGSRSLALARARTQARAAARAHLADVTPRASALYPMHGSRASRGAFAGASHENRALSEWNPGLGSADGDLLGDLPTLRARSRHSYNNNPIAAGAIETNVTSVVGPGLMPRPRIDRELLGLTEAQADEWERQAMRWFRLWASTVACDVTGRADFGGLQSQVLIGELVDGDIVATRRFVERPGELFGTRVQLIEADRVANPNFGPDTDRLVGGIGLDQFGAPDRFHVLNRHPGDVYFRPGAFAWDAIPVYGPASGERVTLHQYAAKRPGQTRGIPYLAPVIEILKQIERLTEAELMASVLSSFFTVFVKQNAIDEDGADLGINVPDSDDADDTRPLVSTAASQTQAQRQLKMGKGLVVDLGPDEDITIADPGRPNGKFDPFFLAMVRIIGAGTGIPFEVLMKHFTASYSASRAAILEAWRGFLTRRTRLVRGFCHPVYGWVIGEGVARGYLRAPGFFGDPLIRQAWLRAAWVGPVQGHIQPLQEAKAQEVRLLTGVKTLEEEIAETTGGDWEESHTQQVKERRMRERDGLVAPVVAPVAPGAAPAAPADDEAVDEDPDEADERERRGQEDGDE